MYFFIQFSLEFDSEIHSEVKLAIFWAIKILCIIAERRERVCGERLHGSSRRTIGVVLTRGSSTNDQGCFGVATPCRNRQVVRDVSKWKIIDFLTKAIWQFLKAHAAFFGRIEAQKSWVLDLTHYSKKGRKWGQVLVLSAHLQRLAGMWMSIQNQGDTDPGPEQA